MRSGTVQVVTSLNDLDNLQQMLLRALSELTGQQQFTDTESASKRVVELLREAGGSFTIYTTPPWFGLRDAVEGLEEAGLAKIDPGIAEFVAPGQPAPTVGRLFLDLTDDGRTLATQLG